MIDLSNQIGRQQSLQAQYDFIVVGAGAAGSVLAAELSASGAQVLVIESGGPDDAPTIANPSVWFYNVGGPLDYHLPVNPSPQLNNRKFNMALGHVVGGGSSRSRPSTTSSSWEPARPVRSWRLSCPRRARKSSSSSQEDSTMHRPSWTQAFGFTMSAARSITTCQLPLRRD